MKLYAVLVSAVEFLDSALSVGGVNVTEKVHSGLYLKLSTSEEEAIGSSYKQAVEKDFRGMRNIHIDAFEVKEELMLKALEEDYEIKKRVRE